MPVPTQISDLSVTIASNSPAGSESAATTDDYLRAHAGFIAQLDASKAPKVSPTFSATVAVAGFITAVGTGGATDFASNAFRRNAAYSGGAAGFVNACVRGDTYVTGANATAYEWAVVGVCDNSATAGENVGGYFQGIKRASAGPTWGAVAEVIDHGSGNPASGVVALEVDVTGNGTDSSNNRIGIDIVSRKRDAGGTVNTTAFGIRLQNETGSKYTVGLDMSTATLTQAGIKLPENTGIGFNSGATRQLYHNGNSYVFADPTTATSYWGLNDDGSITSQGVQLIGNRGAAVADAAGGTTIDAEARTAINALLARLRTHGLIAT